MSSSRFVRRVLPKSVVIGTFLLYLTNCLAISAPPTEERNQSNKAATLPPPPPIGGGLFVVNSSGDGGNVGGTVCDDGTGNCTLRAAIEAANNAPGDNTVRFSIPTSDPGYDPSSAITTIPLTRALPDISTNISFLGPGPDTLSVTRGTLISGYRIFRVTTAGTVSFSGLTISKGTIGSAGGGFGGGIQNTSTGTVNIDRCIITGNHASVAGGGIDNSFTGVVNVSNSIISDNGASQGGTLGFGGGGIFNNRGTVTISRSTVTRNITNDSLGGGGIRNLGVDGTITINESLISENTGGGITSSGNVTITASTISNNSMGGGVIFSGDKLTIASSTISGNNTVFSGGGIYKQSGTADIVNSTISGNRAAFGGGVWNESFSTTNLSNCTVTNNSASSVGGGLNNEGVFNVKSNIVAGNTSAGSGPDVWGTFTSAGFNLIGIDQGNGFFASSDQKGGTVFPLDPKLGSLANNGGPTQTIALQSGSPAINTGAPDAAPRDQRGFVRQNTPDIGAFEFHGLLPVSLGNISTRGLVGIRDEVLIGGFIINGASEKTVLLRAIGPSLSNPPVSLTGTLQDPTISLFGSGGLIMSNDHWADAVNAQSIDPSLRPTNSLESAILISLVPGPYTAIVSGVNGGTGIGLVEVFDLDSSVPSKLANISTRGLVETGDNVLIGGFIIRGVDPDKVVIRAIGPSLAYPPISLTNVLQNPSLSLFNDQGGVIQFNDDWQTDQANEIIATGLQPTNPAESAIVRTLAPGNHTAIVSGVDNTTGIGLVEVFALN